MMALPDKAVAISADNDARINDGSKVYLVGGGIAAMAAAVFMIRDGDIPGCNITIIEELDKIGGSLDGAGSAADGYVLRGGRMLAVCSLLKRNREPSAVYKGKLDPRVLFRVFLALHDIRV